MKYKVTVKKCYDHISFVFTEMHDASYFAWECIEQAAEDVTVVLSKIEENEDA